MRPSKSTRDFHQALINGRIPFRVLVLRTALSFIVIQFLAGEATPTLPTMLVADTPATKPNTCLVYQSAHLLLESGFNPE